MNFSSEDYQLLDFALREDVGAGDVTSEFFVGENDQASARAIAKERAVVAGTEVAAEIFRRVDPDLRLEIAQKDGAVVSAGTTVLEIRGRAETLSGDAPDDDGHLSRHFIRIHPRRITGWNLVPDSPGFYTRDVRTIACPVFIRALPLEQKDESQCLSLEPIRLCHKDY